VSLVEVGPVKPGGDTQVSIDGVTFASLLAGIDFTASRSGWFRRLPSA
jgi:transposase